VASFANHNNTTIDKTITLMNNSNGKIGVGKNAKLNVNGQFMQLLKSWSEHYLSWTNQTMLDVEVVRYEDMLENPFETFKGVVTGMGIASSDSAIRKAIKLSSFKKLKKAEVDDGFKEKNPRSKVFFRSGISNGYKSELSSIQIESILSKHKMVMKGLNYI
jgi:hypothetical protein